MKKITLLFMLVSLFAFSSTAFAVSFSFEERSGNIYWDLDEKERTKAAKNMLVTNKDGDKLSFYSNRNLWRTGKGEKDNFIRMDLDKDKDTAGFKFSESLSGLEFSYYGGKNVKFNLVLESGDIVSWINDEKVDHDDMATFSAARLLSSKGYDANSAISSVLLTPPDGGNGYLYIGSISFVPSSSLPTATPVPAAVWLLGTGVAGLVALRRRQK